MWGTHGKQITVTVCFYIIGTCDLCIGVPQWSAGHFISPWEIKDKDFFTYTALNIVL